MGPGQLRWSLGENFRGHSPYLFAQNRDCDFPPVRRVAMFEDKHSLPGAQLHFAADNRNRFARPSQDHANMRRHIIGAFSIVHKVVGILWNQAVEKFFKITTRSRIGIFHYDQTATGMLDKNIQNPVANA